MTCEFIWYELLTSDPDAASRFYGSVLGWTASDSGQKEMDYRILSSDDVAVAGLMGLSATADTGMQPGWLGYVGVADVDQCVTELLSAGGAVRMPAMNVPDVGRIAMVADPQGAAFYVMTPAGDAPPTSFAARKPGHGGWHELHTSDSDAAMSFYVEKFGWKTLDTLEMPSQGKYRSFGYGGEQAVGGVFSDPDASRAHWLYYFNVQDINVASRRVSTHEGEVLKAAHRVPSGDWIVHARDPQGAVFSLVGPRA